MATKFDDLKEGSTYEVHRARASYLSVGGIYRAESIGRRDVYLRNVSGGSGTTATRWQIDTANVELTEVLS